MLDTTAVIVTVPGQETVRIGPFIAPTNAARYAERLRAVAAQRRPAATVTTERADQAHPHLPPRVPTDPWALAQDITAEDDQYDGEPPFPDLYTRLGIQVGEDHAQELWEKATGWDGPATDGGSRLDQLAEAAETWRHQRDSATDALRGIAVELWHAGMRNKNDMQTITGMSRATIYEALRAAGIDPTQWRAAAKNITDNAQRAEAAVQAFADRMPKDRPPAEA